MKGYSNQYNIVSPEDDGGHALICYGLTEHTAALIAAAPELLNRLKRTQIVFGAALKVFGENLTEGTREELVRTLEENTQAIAKAERK